MRARGLLAAARLRRGALRRGPHARRRRRRTPGLKVSNSQVEYLLNNLYNERTRKGLLIFHTLGQSIRQLQTTRTTAEDFFGRIADWQRAHGATNGRLRRPIDMANTLSEELRRLAGTISREAEKIEPPEQRIELEAAVLKCDAMAAATASWLSQEQDDTVYWIELDQGPRKRVTLDERALDSGPQLRDLLWNRGPTCVLTSATLSVGSPPGFTFAKSRLGLTRCGSLQLGSPFDYANQVTLHIPRDLPDPSTDNAAFEHQAIACVASLPGADARQGACALHLAPHAGRGRPNAHALAGRAQHPLYAQSDGLPRSKMIAAFKADTQ